ncbi:hypothetical protein ACUXZJ_07225 [Flavobacterium sp. TN-1]
MRKKQLKINAHDELILFREERVNRLKKELFSKLTKVQRLCIQKLLQGEKVVFEINSFAKSALLSSYKGIYSGHELNQVYLMHFDFMDHEDNSICEFYEKQLQKVDSWIDILSKKNK